MRSLLSISFLKYNGNKIVTLTESDIVSAVITKPLMNAFFLVSNFSKISLFSFCFRNEKLLSKKNNPAARNKNPMMSTGAVCEILFFMTPETIPVIFSKAPLITNFQEINSARFPIAPILSKGKRKSPARRVTDNVTKN